MKDVNEQRRERIALAMILVVALGARLAVFFLALQDPGRFYTLDAHGYIAIARDPWAAYTDSASNLWAVGLSRTPGYPLFAAVVLSAWGSEAAVIVAQICLGLVALLLLHRLGRDRLGARVGLSAAAIVAIDPATVLYTNVLQPETLFTALVLAGTLLWSRAASRSEGATALCLMSGLLVGASALVRPIGVLLPVAFLVLAAAGVRPGRRGVAAFVAGSVAVSGGWIARNAWTTGVPVLSTIEGENLLNYRAAGAIAYEEGRDIEEVRRALSERLMRDAAPANPAVISQRQSRLGLRLLFEHPSGALWTALDGVRRLVAGTGMTQLSRLSGNPDPERVESVFERSLQVGAGIYLAALYAAALAGAFRLLAAGRSDVVALTLVFIAYFVLISAGPEANTRFRVPLTPFLALLAASGIAPIRR